jgi:putative PEP-CTERM system histidine kinase
MTSLGVISYAVGGGFFLILTLVLLTGRHSKVHKRMMAAASLLSTVWLLSVSMHSVTGGMFSTQQILELLRDTAWIIFLLTLLGSAYNAQDGGGKLRITYIPFGVVTTLLLISIIYEHIGGPDRLTVGGIDVGITGHLLLSVGGLVLVEQLFRNTRTDLRRSTKYLCIALGSLFAYDFYMYSDALLFQRIDSALWDARGFINAMTVPVLGIAIARDQNWSLEIFVSRRIVFHTTALLGAGIYLLAMGVGGYYVRVYGGDWGVVARAIFLFGAILILLILMFSGQLRASLRVLISKHFFHYKYDYRDEWLRFIRTLSLAEPESQLRERSLRAIAQIIESPSGVLLMRRDSGRFESVARWNYTGTLPAGEPGDSSLVKFLETQEWVINLEEYERGPEFYKDLELPDWLRAIPKAWLIVPLILHEQLLGFVVLMRSPIRRHFNWEDCDLLKTAGRQAASHLAQYDTSQSLADSRQFEACNRLSAYVVHDLKNLIAQLSLLVSNAAKHKNNPQFMEDAVNTVANSVAKMNRLLGHLRSGISQGDNVASLDMKELLRDVISAKTGSTPVPSLRLTEETIMVRADHDRLTMVIGHLVQNAQDATPAEGRVTVCLTREGNQVVVSIEDTGCGMDERFISERLFRPFDTTKGAAGMGIGAFEAREFMRALGGSVDVTSKPGKGTIFTVRMPLHVNQCGDSGSDGTKPRYDDGGNFKEIASG